MEDYKNGGVGRYDRQLLIKWVGAGGGVLVSDAGSLFNLIFFFFFF